MTAETTEWRCPDTGRLCTPEDCDRVCFKAPAEAHGLSETQKKLNTLLCGVSDFLRQDLNQNRAHDWADRCEEMLVELRASNVQPKGMPADWRDAMQEALSVCDSVSMSRDRRVVREGCVLYLQTEEWCKWAEQEVAPKLRHALKAATVQAPAPAHSEPVATFQGRRLTPEGTSEFWGWLRGDPSSDPPIGALLYTAPPAPAVGSEPVRYPHPDEDDPVTLWKEIRRLRAAMSQAKCDCTAYCGQYVLHGSCRAHPAPVTISHVPVQHKGGV